MSPDFAFSTILRPAEAQIVSLYRRFESSQWWPAARLRQWQFARAARLVAHARQHVPFYAETPGRLPSGAESEIDEMAWRSLPILTKEEVRAEAARLKSRGLHPGVSVYSEWTTGSSGQPLEVFLTSTFDLIFRAIKLRLLRWHGYDPKGKVCEIRRQYWKTGSAVRRIPRWDRPFGTMFPTGEHVSMNIFSEIEAQVNFLEAEAPNYLLTYPSNLRLLLRAFRRAGKRLPTLRLVRTMAERLDPDLRRECQETLGVPLVDCYGAQEGGFIAIQCPEYAHYHVQSEMNLVEVLREDGAPCQPGETGRVVITPLHAFAMPFLRYELGDYAEVGEPCPCGRGLPVLRQIYGRKKETLTLPSGERRYSIFASSVFDSLGAVIQYQVVQKSPTVLEVRIVAERPLEKAESDQIVNGLAKQVGPEFEIRLIFVDSIPRLPGGKYMDFISEIESGNQCQGSFPPNPNCVAPVSMSPLPP
jgi:phenylacetate-CoA ligase